MGWFTFSRIDKKPPQDWEKIFAICVWMSLAVCTISVSNCGMVLCTAITLGPPWAHRFGFAYDDAGQKTCVPRVFINNVIQDLNSQDVLLNIPHLSSFSQFKYGFEVVLMFFNDYWYSFISLIHVFLKALCNKEIALHIKVRRPEQTF